MNTVIHKVNNKSTVVILIKFSNKDVCILEDS